MSLLLAPLLSALVLVSPKDAPSESCTLEGTFLVEQADGKLAVPTTAQVYVEELPGLPRRPAVTHEMLQRRRQFEPRFLVVQRGDAVTFINKDPEPHEVHADDVVNTFEGKRETRAEKTDARLFLDVGRTHIGCKLHAKMSAIVLTVPNTLHVGLDGRGGWKLSGLPKRRLSVAFWADGATLVTRRLTPCVDGPVEVTAPPATTRGARCYGCLPEYN